MNSLEQILFTFLKYLENGAKDKKKWGVNYYNIENTEYFQYKIFK